MPVPSVLTITPVLASKRLSAVGEVAVGELVTVTLVGCSGYIASGLRIRVRRNLVDIARFPATDADTWTTADTSNAVGVLNMNTVQAFAAFNGRGDIAVLDCVVIVEMTVTASRTLRVSGRIAVQNWPQVEGDTVPFDLAGWEDGLAAVVATAAATQASLAAHNHGTAGGIQVLHSALSGAGTVSHAAIENALVALAGNVVTLGSADNQMTDRVNGMAATLAQHRHTGSTGEGPKISHADLLDTAGTHAGIEQHFALLDGKVSAVENTNETQAASLVNLGTRATALEGADVVLANQLANLQAGLTTCVLKATAGNSEAHTLPETIEDGLLRAITEDSDYYDLLRFVITLAKDMKSRGMLR